jgi:hypothetical protein
MVELHGNVLTCNFLHNSCPEIHRPTNSAMVESRLLSTHTDNTRLTCTVIHASPKMYD